MIKALIVIGILFISAFLMTSIINNNKFFNKIPNKTIYLLLISLFLVFIVYFRIVNNKESNGSYVPAKLEGSTIIPGIIEYDK